MRYVAIIEAESEPCIVKTNGYKLDLKRLKTPLLVMSEGDSIYLNQKHLDWLMECEKNEIMRKLVGDIESGVKTIRGKEEEG